MVEHRDGDPVDVLLVEDNPGDVRLTQEAFKRANINNDLHVVNDGVPAMAFLEQRGEYADAPRPDLVLLDLNLSKMDGLEVLEEIKTDDDLHRIPVIILTSSRAEEDIVQSYEQYTNAYLTKPIEPDEFVDVIQSFERFWLTVVELPPDPN